MAGMCTVVSLAAVTLNLSLMHLLVRHQESWDKMVGGAASDAHTLILRTYTLYT